MAEDESKTEAASQRRLEKAFEEGQVPVGKDSVMVAGLAAGVAALIFVAGPVRDGLVRLVAAALAQAASTPFSALAATAVKPMALALLACLATPVAITVVTLAQTRGGFWPHLAVPDLTRLFQAQRLSRLLKTEFLIDLALASVKVLAIGFVLWRVLRADFLTLGRLLTASPGAQLVGIFAPVPGAAAKALGAMAVLAGADLALTRSRFFARMKMTREEARREHREDEGDPLIRGRRKRKHREITKARAAVEVPRADALVVNPTHIAIAIRYRKSEGKAPKVTAKGKGHLAEIMRDLARENGVPIVQDIPLARLLYRKVKVDREVPAETFRAVAAILAFVYRVTGRTPGSGGADA